MVEVVWWALCCGGMWWVGGGTGRRARSRAETVREVEEGRSRVSDCAQIELDTTTHIILGTHPPHLDSHPIKPRPPIRCLVEEVADVVRE